MCIESHLQSVLEVDYYIYGKTKMQSLNNNVLCSGVFWQPGFDKLAPKQAADMLQKLEEHYVI